ncbi:MAG: hypothetical protein INR69_09190 [Mucilaginibacter polytrichastri]|nr:hypothetical protein [Mucilaginibacter polytrichastri]
MNAPADILISLRRRWQFLQTAALLLCALAGGLFCMTILAAFSIPAVWALLFSLAIFGVLLLLFKPWTLSEFEVCRIIDREMPASEESAALLLRSPDELSLLERLQAEKIAENLRGNPKPAPLRKFLIRSVVIAVLCSIAALALLRTPLTYHQKMTGEKGSAFAGKHAKPEKTLPAITSVSLQITPPAYTGKPARTQQRFGILAEQGATISWSIRTNTAVVPPVLIFNQKEVLRMKAVGKDSTNWTLSKPISKAGFYQVLIAGKRSELYPVEVIPDHPPVVRIRKPKPYTTIDFGRPQKAALQIEISDDYGLSEASLTTTLASGKGESVKFKEEKTGLPGISGRKTSTIQQVLDLKKKGMQPGDELYFYVTASDRNRQQTRSDVYIIALADTAELMSMNGLVKGVDLVPEYFRSQRQIIIETEALIAAKDTITTERFKNKSNDLGADQKLLRLRYGKFLGEENETSIGDDGHDDHDHGRQDAPAAFGNAQAIMDPYTHKHDNAEDATFFEPEQKKQLKDVLTEMWNSELRLRTYKPQDALPYAYKALRLLKDLQQKERAYVAKTAFNPPPIKPEKRLSGELDKVTEPLALRKTEPENPAQNVLMETASLLNLMPENSRLSAQETRLLQSAATEIRERALQDPKTYLPAVTAVSQMLNGKTDANNIRSVQRALQRIIASPETLPQAGKNTPGGLSARYFEQLNRQRR